jgi:hypothetical protein
MDTEKLLDAAQKLIENQPRETRVNYVNLVGLRKIVAEREARFRIALSAHDRPSPLEIGNAIPFTLQEVAAPCVSEFTNLRSCLSLLENCPEHQAAHATIQPLVDEFERLKNQLLDEQRALSEAENAVADAESAARAALLAKIDTDPRVKSAKSALAGIKRLGEPLVV